MSYSEFPDGKKQAPKAYDLGGSGTKYNNWRGLMFSVLYKSGDQAAFPYAYIQQIAFDKSGRLVIEMPSESIVVEGINLSDLYYSLVDHQVREMVEADTTYQAAAKGEPFITSIKTVAPTSLHAAKSAET